MEQHSLRCTQLFGLRSCSETENVQTPTLFQPQTVSVPPVVVRLPVNQMALNAARCSARLS